MKPGIYIGLANEQYHAAEGISKSGLDLIARSPYLYRHRQQVAAIKTVAQAMIRDKVDSVEEAANTLLATIELVKK